MTATSGGRLRVAAGQCRIDGDRDVNLGRLVGLVERAAAAGADLVVLPGCAVHRPGFTTPEEAWAAAVELEGAGPGEPPVERPDPFVGELRRVARRTGRWVAVGLVVRRDPAYSDVPARVTATTVLIDGDGEVVGQADASVLLSSDGAPLGGAAPTGVVVPTPWGPVGLGAGDDALLVAPPRWAAVAGARLLLAPLATTADDVVAVHLRARAAESGIWVAAGAALGPLLDEGRARDLRHATGAGGPVPEGVGPACVIGPDGGFVARCEGGQGVGEMVGEVAVCDVDLAAGSTRPDGTDPIGLRRPEVYGPLTEDVVALPPTGAERARVVVIPRRGGPDELAAALARAAADADLVVLPELPGEPEGLVPTGGAADAATRSARLVVELTSALAGTGAHVALSIVEETREGWAHVGVLVSARGVELHQPALHAPARHAGWQSVLGDRQKVVALPWARVAVAVGDDVLVPEVARLAALGGAEVLAAPSGPLSATELDVVLAARSAEQRCVVVASGDGVGRLFDPPTEDPWGNRHRIGPAVGPANVAVPMEPEATGDGALRGVVHPARAAEAHLTATIDLVHGSPWPPEPRVAPSPDPGAG